MDWYIAKIVFNIVSGNGDHRPQFDEQYRLIKADDRSEAYHKAILIGRGEEEILLNHKQELVRWDFVNVSELFRVSELRDGMELFSSIYEAEDRTLHLETVNMKAAYVQSKLQLEKEKV